MFCPRFGHHFGAVDILRVDCWCSFGWLEANPLEPARANCISDFKQNRPSGPEVNKNSIGFSIGCLMCFLLRFGWILEVERGPKLEQKWDQKWSRKKSVFWKWRVRKTGGYGGPGER